MEQEFSNSLALVFALRYLKYHLKKCTDLEERMDVEKRIEEFEKAISLSKSDPDATEPQPIPAKYFMATTEQ